MEIPISECKIIKETMTSLIFKNMILLQGKDKDFFASWDCSKQFYTVFYKGKMLRTNLSKLDDIKPYLVEPITSEHI